MRPTVVILTYCEHPALAYGALLVFDTLRVGFPTFDIVVVDNGSHPDVVPQIEAAAEKAGALFTPAARHNFMDHYKWWLCEQELSNAIILLDPDVVFWQSVEDWKFDGAIAGRLIPDLKMGDITSLSRLHPSHAWIPDVKRLRDLGISVELRHEGNQFWDTLATICQDHSSKCQSFTEQQLDCYDHLFYGSHLPVIEPRLNDNDLTLDAHRHAAAGNIQSLKGIWREQDKYFKSDAFVGMDPQTILSKMEHVYGELGRIQKIGTDNAIDSLLANIYNQLPVATKEMMAMPQAECSVVHHFGPGLCVREVSMPAGTLAIGHKQKFEHMNVLLKGSVVVINDDGSTKVLTAPLMFIGKPGQKVGYVLEDLVWQNIYATELKDVDAIEAHFVEKCDEWQQDQLLKTAQAALTHEADRADYHALLVESGFSHETALAQSEDASDLLWVDSALTRVSKSSIQGKGLFVTSPVKIGEIICPARVDGYRTQAGRYTNHSASPNAKMILQSNGDIDLIAISDFEGCKGGGIGTEVTIDYRQALALSGIEFAK
jgi:hypothetical protein